MSAARAWGRAASRIAAIALAAAAADPAARLEADLTPTGAERAGNASGTIPPWTGGVAPVPRAGPGVPRGDPFAADRPRFTITQANWRQYAALLPAGMQALFARDPDQRMLVYPTRRSAALPPSVTAAIARNARTAHAAPEGIEWGVEGAAGGLPFPVPANGAEAIWNHLLGYWGPARENRVQTWSVLPDGGAELVNDARETVDFPYYQGAPAASPGRIFVRREVSAGPAERAGSAYVQKQPLNAARDRYVVWEYLPGERRVRQSPALSYDTPDPAASGLQSFDDYYMFSGSPDRYDYRLLGKREMLIPYNENRLFALPIRQILRRRHPDPDTLRYERHRVWVVDATLRRGAHHISPHRRFYLDEDSWMIVYVDAWDAQGHLWKFTEAAMYLLTDLPAMVPASQFVFDLDSGAYVFAFAFNNQPQQYAITPPHQAADFTPEALTLRALR